jgi:hypothetical protein
MRWVAKIYRGNEVAKLPVDGAKSSDEVCQMVEEVLGQAPGSLSFEKATSPPEFDKSARFRKINNVNYAIIIEQVG